MSRRTLLQHSGTLLSRVTFFLLFQCRKAGPIPMMVLSQTIAAERAGVSAQISFPSAISICSHQSISTQRSPAQLLGTWKECSEPLTQTASCQSGQSSLSHKPNVTVLVLNAFKTFNSQPNIPSNTAYSIARSFKSFYIPPTNQF